MGGVRGKSGPPGNLNASKHGLTTWLRRRALPKQKQHVAKLVEEYRLGLLACKGGLGTVTEMEQALIENAAKSFGACLLILEEAATKGLTRKVDGSWDLSPGFARLAAFLAAERMALATLGLGRRAKDVTTLDELLADAADEEPA